MGPTQKPEAKSRFQFVEIALVAAVCLLTLPEAWFHWISLRFNPQWAPITTIVGMSMGIASVFIRDDWRTSTTPFIRKLAVFLLTVLIAFAVIRLFSTVPIVWAVSLQIILVPIALGCLIWPLPQKAPPQSPNPTHSGATLYADQK